MTTNELNKLAREYLEATLELLQSAMEPDDVDEGCYRTRILSNDVYYPDDPNMTVEVADPIDEKRFTAYRAGTGLDTLRLQLRAGLYGAVLAATNKLLRQGLVKPGGNIYIAGQFPDRVLLMHSPGYVIHYKVRANA